MPQAPNLTASSGWQQKKDDLALQAALWETFRISQFFKHFAQAIGKPVGFVFFLKKRNLKMENIPSSPRLQYLPVNMLEKSMAGK